MLLATGLMTRATDPIFSQFLSAAYPKLYGNAGRLTMAQLPTPLSETVMWLGVAT
jgi:hypothetical protein